MTEDLAAVARRNLKEAKRYRSELLRLTDIVKSVVEQIDRQMDRPESYERGRKIAEIMNRLEMANDLVRLSTLGIDVRDMPGKKKG